MEPDGATEETSPVVQPRWMTWTLLAAGIVGLVVALRIALG